MVGGVTGLIKNNSYVVKFHIDEQLLAEKVSEIARTVVNYIFVNLKDLTQNTFIFFVQFSVMLYTLFYFVRYGERFLDKTFRIFSLGEGRETFLYDRFVNTAKTTLKVTIIIGGVQGTLGGLIFWFTGIEGAADAGVW